MQLTNMLEKINNYKNMKELRAVRKIKELEVSFKKIEFL
jgi:hypothetical protein